MKNIALFLSLLLPTTPVLAEDLFSQTPATPGQSAPMQQSEPEITEYQDWLHICVEQQNQEIYFIQQTLAEEDPPSRRGTPTTLFPLSATFVSGQITPCCRLFPLTPS